MKLLTISLTNSCNRRCYYCPVKRWLVPLEGAREKNINVITNAALLKWLDAYIPPDEWIIELTGGEPGLYPEIQTLIPALAARGYRGVIKTNGTLPIPKRENFQLITAWHEGVEQIPEYYDQIAIIKNPNDDWERKVRHCEEKGIPYQTVLFDRKFEGKQFDNTVCSVNKTTATLHVNSSGKITGCSAKPPEKGHDIFNMWPPIPFSGLTAACPRCKNVNDVEKFLLPDLKDLLERDYEEYGKETANAAELDRRLAELNAEEAKARATIDEDYAAEWQAKIAAVLAIKQQPGWPVAVVWPE